jgi:hypothetical protein
VSASNILIVMLAAFASGSFGFVFGVAIERDRWQR